MKLAQTLDTTELAKTRGPELLLELFETALKPRKTLEARELYAAGSRDGGMMSRQMSEPMSSYIMRRRTWWALLQQLDPEIQVSEGILAEQMLQNAFITEDQKLMIRTTLGGKLKVDSVADELLNQHPRVHERERHGKGRGFQSGKQQWRPRGYKGQSWATYADEEASEEADCDTTSQSLAGFTEFNAEEQMNDEAYGAFYEEAESVEDWMADYMALYLDTGLDMDNEEACMLAAESLQLESEAFFVRSQAKGKGHTGFTGGRSFEVSGQLSLQEKRARLQQLQARTECRKCGQKGHWSGDPQCPRNNKDSSRKTTSTSSTSVTSASKGGKKGKKPKTRVVYFAMRNNDAATSSETTWSCNMAVEDNAIAVNPSTPLQSSGSLNMTGSPSMTGSMSMPGPLPMTPPLNRSSSVLAYAKYQWCVTLSGAAAL